MIKLSLIFEFLSPNVKWIYKLYQFNIMLEACEGRHSYNGHLNFKGNDKQKMSLLTHIDYSEFEVNKVWVEIFKLKYWFVVLYISFSL